jgi:hypothetical protein
MCPLTSRDRPCPGLRPELACVTYGDNCVEGRRERRLRFRRDFGELHVFVNPDFVVTARHSEAPDLSGYRATAGVEPVSNAAARKAKATRLRAREPGRPNLTIADPTLLPP